MKRRTLLLGAFAAGLEWLISACTPKTSQIQLEKQNHEPIHMSDPELESTPNPSPKPATVFLDPQDVHKAQITESMPNTSLTLSDTHSFHVQMAQEDGSEITVHIQLPSLPQDEKDTLPFRIFRNDEHVQIPLEDEQATLVFDKETTRLKVRLIQSGQYSIGRNNSLLLPQTLRFDDPPSFSSKPYGLLSVDGLSNLEPDPFVKDLKNSSLLRRGRQRVQVICIHGMYQEHRGNFCRFDEFFDFLKNEVSVDLKVFLEENCDFFVYRYDSRKSVDENALELFGLIGQRPYLLFAHSMGGLLARIVHALSHLLKKKFCLGVITLCTPHHGTPLAIPRWVRSVCARLPFGGQIYVLYLAIINNFFAEIQFTTFSKKISVGVQALTDTLFPKGFRCLFFDGSSPGIPHKKFISPVFVNGVFPIQEELSPDDSFGAICDKTPLTEYVPDTEKKTGSVGCRLNFIKLLAALEQKAGISELPFLTAHGGYLSSSYLQSGHSQVIDLAVTTPLELSVKNHSDDFEEQALRLFAGVLLPFFPLATQEDLNSFIANDGLVPLASQFFLKDGPSFVKRESQSTSFLIQQDILQGRIPLCMRANYLWKDVSHGTVLKKTNENFLFTRFVQDIKSYIDTLRAEESNVFSFTDEQAIQEVVESALIKNYDETFYDSNGRGIFSHSFSLVDFSVVPDTTIPDFAVATFSIFEDVTKYQNGISSPKNSGTTLYRMYFTRVRGIWLSLGYQN